jgi:hypothetical protein
LEDDIIVRKKKYVPELLELEPGEDSYKRLKSLAKMSWLSIVKTIRDRDLFANKKKSQVSSS